MELRRSRARHTKSIGGCQTCKIRRVRCDLGRPRCRRCASTGRVCDGPSSEHVFVFQQSNVQNVRVNGSQSLRAPLKALPSLSQPDESRAFAFYLARAAPFLAGALDEGLWDILVPRLVQSDAAIKYTVCAISHFFEHPMRSNHNGKVSISPISKQHLPALTWQARALTADRTPNLNCITPNVLVKIILFSSLEFQQNNFRGALHLIKLGYKLVAPLLTAGFQSLYGWTSSEDEVVNVVMPICMRSACLIFTSWDDLDERDDPLSTTESLDHAIFRTLCITYASLKDTYLALKSKAHTTILKLRNRQSELRSVLQSLEHQAQYFSVNTDLKDKDYHRACAFQEYCKIGLSWLDLLNAHSITPPSNATIFLSAILEHNRILKSRCKTLYPRASSTKFFQQMTIAPTAYLVAIFAPCLSLRNEALQLMNYLTIERPNTQIHAVVMSLEGEVVNVDNSSPSFQLYCGYSEEDSSMQKVYDIQIPAPNVSLERVGAGNWAFVAKRMRHGGAQDEKTQVACVMGDMNGVYPANYDVL